jgi:hypothetical protein
MKKYLLIIFVLVSFSEQTIFAQNKNQMHVLLDECFEYLSEQQKNNAKKRQGSQWINGNMTDTLFVQKEFPLNDLYFAKNDNVTQNSKIVFIYVDQFAKKKTEDHLYRYRGIKLIENKIIIVFCDYGIRTKRKILKKEICYAYSGTTYFSFQYSEEDKQWKMVDVEMKGI